MKNILENDLPVLTIVREQTHSRKEKIHSNLELTDFGFNGQRNPNGQIPDHGHSARCRVDLTGVTPM